jgi:hypothetical protein
MSAAILTLRRQVANLAPGQRIKFDRHTLEFAQPRVPAWMSGSSPAAWPVPDQVLTGIMGSGKEFGYSKDWRGQHITFWRLERPVGDDRWTYIDPDRRDGWVKGLDDIWRRESVSV